MNSTHYLHKGSRPLEAVQNLHVCAAEFLVSAALAVHYQDWGRHAWGREGITHQDVHDEEQQGREERRKVGQRRQLGDTSEHGTQAGASVQQQGNGALLRRADAHIDGVSCAVSAPHVPPQPTSIRTSSSAVAPLRRGRQHGTVLRRCLHASPPFLSEVRTLKRLDGAVALRKAHLWLRKIPDVMPVG